MRLGEVVDGPAGEGRHAKERPQFVQKATGNH